MQRKIYLFWGGGRGFYLKNKRMGKYMKKKSKVAVVVEGVRTRAKTLALQQRLNSGLGGVVVDESSFCYLQLRSRRLEKSSTPPSKQKQQQHRDREKTSCGEGDNRNQSQDKGSSSLKELENVASNEVGAPEASSGDNIYIADFEPRDRFLFLISLLCFFNFQFLGANFLCLIRPLSLDAFVFIFTENFLILVNFFFLKKREIVLFCSVLFCFVLQTH